MAKMIASSNGGELFKIEPTKAYPTRYTPCTEVVKEELDNGIFRQVKKAPDFSKYDRSSCMVAYSTNPYDSFP